MYIYIYVYIYIYIYICILVSNDFRKSLRLQMPTRADYVGILMR